MSLELYQNVDTNLPPGFKDEADSIFSRKSFARNVVNKEEKEWRAKLVAKFGATPEQNYYNQRYDDGGEDE